MLTFETAVNSLGSLSVSKAISSKSKVVVKPAFCNKGQEVQFKVQMFSSTGNLIVDEDVGVCLMVNGNIFKIIKCAIDESFSSFIGIWVPDKPMKLSWIVVSNGITLATLNGVLDVDEPNKSIRGRIVFQRSFVYFLTISHAVYHLLKYYFLCFADDGGKQNSVSIIMLFQNTKLLVD